jgi:hypothetical protein
MPSLRRPSEGYQSRIRERLEGNEMSAYEVVKSAREQQEAKDAFVAEVERTIAEIWEGFYETLEPVEWPEEIEEEPHAEQ